MPPSRRNLFAWFTAAAAFGGAAGWLRALTSTYHDGPVSDHFDGTENVGSDRNPFHMNAATLSPRGRGVRTGQARAVKRKRRAFKAHLRPFCRASDK